MHTYAIRRYLSSLEDRLKLVESRVATLENGSPKDLGEVTMPVTISDAGSTDTAQEQETASLRDDSPDNANSTRIPLMAWRLSRLREKMIVLPLVPAFRLSTLTQKY